MNNSKELIEHIEASTKTITAKIINLIKEDDDRLEKLDIHKGEIPVGSSVSKMIQQKLSSLENKEAIDALLKYVIGDYLIDDDSLPLFHHYVSADSYSKQSALFVFQCSDQFFCYFYGDELTSTITNNPIDFCLQAALEVMQNFEFEEANLEDDWFEDSEPSNELSWNFNFTEL